MSQLAILFARYVAAIAAACAVSLVIVYLFFNCLVSVMAWFGIVGIIILFPVVGFCGVFSGTFCLPPSSRRSGSIILLFLGLAFSAFLSFYIGVLTGAGSIPFIWLFLIAGGGYSAVCIFRRRDRLPNKPEESYQGPRCVSCEQPIQSEVKICPKCGYTQPI
jgi:hypothetical protein